MGIDVIEDEMESGLIDSEANIGPLRNYIGFHLRRAQDVSFQAFSRRVDSSDLNAGHFTILAIIQENPGLNQTALSLATGRDKSTLTPALKGLEAQGYVARTRSTTDRRAYHLGLTPEGESYLARLKVHALAHDKLLDEIVGDFHKPLLIHLLERIVEGLGKPEINGDDD
ncbi:MarR family transcriptional regulator [Sphingomonas sp. C3-2]|uniref:MarR family winged helix-turn-helix transcriptional regulator n=1 Tax=Sphingomonas sp. C3-2 TaxID=3062169 RepID=UPI00294ABCC2|nr:MarR family transcriptional regulator [Sphingomonas sp. C3-2]WOK37983.1 MarR family transcriptional regulator [Sphingomonas sp. C3-2]